ncbi:MAG: glutathione S-transferase N-terminal domain-containing protein [Burkholderiaceae bacterium]|jgi:glutathione S-transferase|nr:glutathione S-transferase N-terminal domain-containing protein [Burkholderiaceae bacterium]
MRLIGNLTSPYVRKVRVVLAEKKLDYKLVLENPWEADSPVARANPLCQVPCLVMEGQEAVFDSRVIVEYLDSLSPVGKLIPSESRQRVEVKTWEALADGLCDAALTAQMEQTWPDRTAAQRCQPWIERQLDKIHAALAAMSSGLAAKPWCSASVHLSLADIAVGCALGYLDLRFPRIDWRARHDNLAQLMERLNQRPSFAETAPPAT